MSRLPPQQQDFVADYAAKRQAQMDRARMLRENREASARGGASDGPYGGAPVQLPPAQQQQPQYGYASQQTAQPQPQQAQPRPSSNNAYGGAAPSSGGGYGYQQPPPPQQSTLRPPGVGGGYAPPHPPRSAEIPSSSHYGAAPAPQHTSPTLGSAAGSVAVSESDFKKAVSLGIITSEQCRQLWTALQSPHVSAPQVRGSTTTSSLTRVEAPPASAYGGGTVAFGGGAAASRGSQQQQQQAKPASGGFRDDPVWNDEPVHSAPLGGPTPRSGGGPSSRSAKPDWTVDDNASDGTFGAPPPVPGRQPAKSGGISDRQAQQQPQQQQQQPRLAPSLAAKAAQRMQQQQQQYDDPPPPPPPAPVQSRYQQQQQPAAATRQTGFGANRRNAAQEPPPPPPPPPEDPEEVEEFLRQKQEAAQRLAEELNQIDDSEPLEECGICGRNFRQSIIDRHEQACRVAHKKRKQFDMKGQRLDGIDGIEEVKRTASRAAPRRGGAAAGGGDDKPAAAAGKMPKWKAQHLQFQQAMQAVRQQDAGGAITVAVGGRGGGGRGGGFAPPPPAEDYDIRVPCPHCGRKFAEDTAERHIPKCKSIINKPNMLQRKR